MVKPNSHFWTCLEELINIIQLNKSISKKYILKGLKNTLKQGYDIKKIKKKEEK